jgi:serine/threonine protein kinase
MQLNQHNQHNRNGQNSQKSSYGRGRCTCSSVPTKLTLPPVPKNRFVLLEIIGVGSFGKVRNALDTYMNKSVAIKLISLDNCSLRHLEAEVAIMTTCRSPHLVHVQCFGRYQDEDNAWLVMELCGGGSIRNLAHNGGPWQPRSSVGKAYISRMSLRRRCAVCSICTRPTLYILTSRPLIS